MDEAPPGPAAQSAAELKEQIEAERVGRPFLVHRNEAGEQRIRPLTAEREELWIGRSPSADVALLWDGEVSTLHAQIELAAGECTLVDDGLSRNGSFVNEERIGGRRRLRDGDVIRVGRSRILFRVPPADGSGAAASTVISTDAISAAGVSPAQKRVLVELCRPYKQGASFATPPTNAEVAAELHISVDAVKTHLRTLFEKFDLAEVAQSGKRVALVQRAMQAGLITDRDL